MEEGTTGLDITAISTSISDLATTTVAPLGAAVVGVILAVAGVRMAMRMVRGV